MFSWPSKIPLTDIPLTDAADKWGFGSWVIGWSPIGLNVCLLMVGSNAALTAQDARYIDIFGKISLSLIGVVSMGVGVGASVTGQENGTVHSYGIVANTLSPLPNLFQFLRIEAIEEGSEGLTLAIKLLLDFFSGAGTSVALFLDNADIISAVESTKRIPVDFLGIN